MNNRFLSATGMTLGAFIVLIAANGEAFMTALLGVPTLVQAWSAVLPFGVWSTLLALVVAMGLWGFAIRWLGLGLLHRPPEFAADVLSVLVAVAVTVTQVTGQPANVLLQAVWMGMAAGFLAPVLCRGIRSGFRKAKDNREAQP